jgi:hypothetical protein
MIRTEKNYHGRKYIFCDDNGNLNFEIDEPQEIKTPEYFTKYYSINKNSIDSVLNNYLYAAHPKQFNDPFDCFPYLIDTSDISDNDIDEIAEQFKRINIELDKEKIKNDRIEFSRVWDLVFSSCGIISLNDSETENPNLWANYASNNKGFSVTYDKKSFPNEYFCGPFRIDYQNKLCKYKFDRDYIGNLFLYLTTVKSNDWSGEKEWRYIALGKDTMYIPCTHHGLMKEQTIQNRKFTLAKNAITEIKLGFLFFNVCDYEKRENYFYVNLNNDEENDLKFNLLSFAKHNNIKVSMMYLDKLDFKFVPVILDYELFESKTLKFRIPLK